MTRTSTPDRTGVATPRVVISGSRDVVVRDDLYENIDLKTLGEILVPELSHPHSPTEWNWQDNLQTWTEDATLHTIVETLSDWEHHVKAAPEDPYRVLEANETVPLCSDPVACEMNEQIRITQEYLAGSFQLWFKYDFLQETEILILILKPWSGTTLGSDGYGLEIYYDPVTMELPEVRIVNGAGTILDSADAIETLDNTVHTMTISRGLHGNLLGKVDGVELVSHSEAGIVSYPASSSYMLLYANHTVNNGATLVPVYYDMVTRSPLSI